MAPVAIGPVWPETGIAYFRAETAIVLGTRM